jgi:hypothetical protein
VPKAPYPERLKEPKNGGKLEDILEVFKQVQINIPFLDAIQQIPSYAKFLKDLVTVKRKTNVPKKAFMIEQVSAIRQCKLPLGRTKFRYSQLHEPLVRIAFMQVPRSNHKEPCIV